MNQWVIRAIVVVLAIAFLPLVVNGVAHFATEAVNSAGTGIKNLLAPLRYSGSAKVEGVIRLCLYLIAVVLIIRFLSGRRG